MTNTTLPPIDLPQRLRTVSTMIHMGEKIAWGQETALMDEAADEIVRLRKLLEWEYMTPAMRLTAFLEGSWKRWRKK
jgi:hypothetical protein